MELADIIARIKPCDMNQPYIFVSYSNEDRARVWEDVLVLQELGYNVWLDEKNLDKTKDSWKKDALSAISDMYCKLLIFYVSRHSLSSKNCYDELERTIAEETTDIHLDPLPFIAIDVEEVGDIGRFTRQVHLDCMGDPSLSKNEKTLRAKTLSSFRKNFFDSNNERVRIHPKDEPNRSSDYYENIVDSLSNLQIPPIYPPVRELPGKKRREEEARQAAEKRRQEEEARREAERKRQEEEARQAAERRRQEEEAARIAEQTPLADRMSQLIRRRTTLLGEAAVSVAETETTISPEPPKPEEKKPSLEEQIRQRLVADADTKESLRFDGVYQCRDEGGNCWQYLRFFSDGVVVGVSSTGTAPQVIRWLNKTYENHGSYQITGDQITFELTSTEGKVSYSGKILSRESLALDTVSHINGHSSHGKVYSFCQC